MSKDYSSCYYSNYYNVIDEETSRECYIRERICADFLRATISDFNKDSSILEKPLIRDGLGIPLLSESGDDISYETLNDCHDKIIDAFVNGRITECEYDKMTEYVIWLYKRYSSRRDALEGDGMKSVGGFRREDSGSR